MSRAGALCCLLAVAPAMAADTPPQNSAPDAALLEFLGEWEGDDGQWLDPRQFEQEMDRQARQRRDQERDDD